MFTGIIEEIGTVAMIQRGQYSAVLKIQAKTVLEGTRIGDSIAVNGVCLTVTELFPDSFKADVMHETLDRSALADMGSGSRVNLERAMPADGRFGGISSQGMLTALAKSHAFGAMIPQCGIRLRQGKRFCAISWRRVLSH